MKIRIKNAWIFDPETGKNGETGDVCIDGGVIVSECLTPDLVIDAENRLVMAGATEIHAHIATYGLNMARGNGWLPKFSEMAEKFLRLGFVHINEPLSTIHTAGAVHQNLAHFPWLDTSMLLALPLYDLESYIREGKVEECAQLICGLANMAGSIGLKLYESELYYHQEIYQHRNIESEKLFEFFARVAEKISQRIVIHTRESLPPVGEAAGSFHLAHIGGILKNTDNLESLENLFEKGITADLGIGVSGDHIQVTSSPPDKEVLGFHMDIGLTESIHIYKGAAWGKKQEENVCSLIARDEGWPLAFSTDYPNMAPVDAYPELWAKIANQKSLFYLARITRLNPARFLGFENSGHLATGARANVVIYDIFDRSDEKQMRQAFSGCRYLIKDGEVIISDGQIEEGKEIKTTWWRSLPEKNRETVLAFLKNYSFRPVNLQVTEEISGRLAEIPVK